MLHHTDEEPVDIIGQVDGVGFQCNKIDYHCLEDTLKDFGDTEYADYNSTRQSSSDSVRPCNFIKSK